MAHEIETAAFAKPTWHKQGHYWAEGEAPTTIEAAMADAQCNWRVLEKPIFMQGADTDDSTITGDVDGWKALVRETDGKVLHVARDTYAVAQNLPTFTAFQQLVDDGACSIDGVASLRGGKVLFLNLDCKISGSLDSDGDAIKGNLLIVNSHDGSLPVMIMFSAIRVVCANTLAMALSAHRQSAIKIRHRGDPVAAVQDTIRFIDASRRTFALSMDDWRDMKTTHITIDGLRQYARMTLQPDIKVEDTDPRAVDSVIEAYRTAPGSGIAGTTVWGAYNAMTHWLDHTRGHSDDSRAYASTFGSGQPIRRRAHDNAMALCAD